VHIDLYISELLYTNDCVILPGFGGFVANVKSAFLNPAHSTFSPPTKRIAFNAGLKTNDGLLAHYICQREGISFTEAVQKIQRYVDYCFEHLNNNKKLVFEKIGELHFDKEKNIQFEPDQSVNYLISSFGLTAIHSPAIKREGAQVIPLRNSTAKQGKRVSAWRLLELVPVAAAFALLIINPHIVQNLNNSLSSVLPIGTDRTMEVFVPAQDSSFSPYIASNPEPIVSQENTDSLVTVELLQDPNASTENSAANTVESVELSTEVTKAEPSPIATAAAVKVEAPIKDAVTLSTTDKSYYIIGGCFSIPENASNFVASAKAQGYDAKVIGLNDKGFQMVSLFQSSNQQTARAQLSTIKTALDSTVWLYSK
jgi:CCDC81-like prokaryotic HU domain 2/CCDC81-like prokaryotic HU domain 1